MKWLFAVRTKITLRFIKKRALISNERKDPKDGKAENFGDDDDDMGD